MPNLTVAIHHPEWLTVFTIPRGTLLQKGRHGVYHDSVEAAAVISARYGCYSWGTSDAIHYCGCFAKDYGRFKSNLHGRVHNYLQNHRVKPAGQIRAWAAQ